MMRALWIGSSVCVLAGVVPGCAGIDSGDERAEIDHLIAASTVTGTDGADTLGGDHIGFKLRYRLDHLDGSKGLAIPGPTGAARVGAAVADAGDVNGDGIDDMAISAYRKSGGMREVGAVYVVFGRAGGVDRSLDLTRLDGSDGFVVSLPGGHAAWSVAGAGDVNDDGVDDLLIGAPQRGSAGQAGAGQVYVLFGRAQGFPARLRRRDFNGTHGFVMRGAQDSALGESVSGAGDVNGDGVDDFIVGAPGADVRGPGRHLRDAGKVFVVFGRADFGATLALGRLDGASGFFIHGARSGDFLGHAVSSAGDVNGDGLDDVLLGAQWADVQADAQGRVDAGAAYVIFGRAGGFDAAMSMGDLAGVRGFAMQGSRSHGHLGRSVAAAGDVDGDGRADVIVGAPGMDGAYVVFGRPANSSAPLDLLEKGEGFLLERGGVDAGFAPVSGAGDVNGDGYGDVVIGAPHAGDAGAAYVVYGGPGIGGVDDTLYGLGGDDRLYGLAGDDRVEGGPGADLVVGGLGMDELFGGPGRDGFLGEPGADVIDGGDGMDILSFYGKSAGVIVDLEAGMVVDSFAAVDSITGVEEVRGGAGNDVLLGDSEDNVFTAAAGTDRVEGRGGHDGLLGGAGADLLIGGPGSDNLMGQQDADVFVFAPGDGSDHIRDWEDGLDRIDLSAHGLGGFSHLAPLISQDGLHARIELGGGDAIRVLWTDAAALDAGDFIL